MLTSLNTKQKIWTLKLPLVWQSQPAHSSRTARHQLRWTPPSGWWPGQHSHGSSYGSKHTNGYSHLWSSCSSKTWRTHRALWAHLLWSFSLNKKHKVWVSHFEFKYHLGTSFQEGKINLGRVRLLLSKGILHIFGGWLRRVNGIVIYSFHLKVLWYAQQ